MQQGKKVCLVVWPFLLILGKPSYLLQNRDLCSTKIHRGFDHMLTNICWPLKKDSVPISNLALEWLVLIQGFVLFFHCNPQSDWLAGHTGTPT